MSRAPSVSKNDGLMALQCTTLSVIVRCPRSMVSRWFQLPPDNSSDTDKAALCVAGSPLNAVSRFRSTCCDCGWV